MEKLNVKKRDGRIEQFSENKLKKAIKVALFSEKDITNVEQKTLDIYNSILVNTISDSFDNFVDSKTLQGMLENELMKRKFYKAAKHAILYFQQNKDAKFEQERINYMENYINTDRNAATSSETDDNANVTVKNVANLEAEVYKSKNRRIQRKMMYKQLKKQFPEVMDDYEKDLTHHIIYVNDEASSPVLKYYCSAVTMYPLLTDGTSSLDGLKSQPPKNLTSFCGQFNNLVFLLSSQAKGAVAYGEFFNFLDYFFRKEWGDDYYLHDNDLLTTSASLRQETIKDRIIQTFQNIVYTMNQPAGNRGYQSPFTNISYYDKYYWESLFKDFRFPDGTSAKWKSVSYCQKTFIRWFNKERTKTILTFPVESFAMLTDGKQCLDKEYEDLNCEMYAAGHSFFTYISDSPDNLASCCRLRNELDKNEFSFTNGLTGVMTGSCNVITLNLNRIVQDKCKIHNPSDKVQWKHEFKEYLINILERVYKYHIAYKTMLYDLELKKMLSSVNAGYISMNKLYNTIGVNGFNEAARFLGMKVSDNPDYEEFCNLITTTISDQNKKHSNSKFKFNTEFVPAESLGVKNYNWDKKDKYWVPADKNLYNSYFYDAHNTSTNILERFRMQGERYIKNLDGGSALHCNLNEHLTKQQYKDLLNYAIKNGTNYFTYNIPNTQCEDCGFITKHNVNECPKCGSKNVSQWTRIIGYLRPLNKFSEGRKLEAKNRYYI